MRGERVGGHRYKAEAFVQTNSPLYFFPCRTSFSKHRYAVVYPRNVMTHIMIQQTGTVRKLRERSEGGGGMI